MHIYNFRCGFYRVRQFLSQSHLQRRNRLLNIKQDTKTACSYRIRHAADGTAFNPSCSPAGWLCVEPHHHLSLAPRDWTFVPDICPHGHLLPPSTTKTTIADMCFRVGFRLGSYRIRV